MAVLRAACRRSPFARAPFLWTGALAVLMAGIPLFLLVLGRPLPFRADGPDERPAALAGLTLDRAPGSAGGLVVTSVEWPGPAARAGVAVGDRLLVVGGRAVPGPGALRRAIRAEAAPGAGVTADFRRGARRYRVRLPVEGGKAGGAEAAGNRG